MTAADLIHECEVAGISLQVVGGWIRAEPRSRVTPELRERIREHRAEILTELRREQFRDRVWQALQDRPGKIKYFEVEDPDADPVRLVLAIRGVGTCDLLIAADKWDPIRFLELLDSEREVAS